MRIYALILTLALIVPALFGQTILTPGTASVRAEPYRLSPGDDLYTVALANRLLAERAGAAKSAPTWQRARSVSPDLASLPILRRRGLQILKAPVGARVEGMTFLMNESDPAGIVRYVRNTGRLPEPSGSGASMPPSEIEYAGLPSMAVSFPPVLTRDDLLAAAVLLLIIGFALWGAWTVMMSLLRVGTNRNRDAPDLPAPPVLGRRSYTHAVATKPPLVRYEIFREERLKQNKFDPEHMHGGIRPQTAFYQPPTFTMHEHTSDVLAARMRIMRYTGRQIFGVKVSGGFWPTEFVNELIDMAKPQDNDLVVGVYINELGVITGVTLHWRYCLNGTPLDRLEERNRYFIGDETTFSDPTMLKNDSGQPDVPWATVEAYLREQYGVRKRPDNLILMPSPPISAAEVRHIVDVNTPISVVIASQDVPDEQIVQDDDEESHHLEFEVLKEGKFPRREGDVQGVVVAIVVDHARRRRFPAPGAYVSLECDVQEPLRRDHANRGHGFSFAIERGQLTVRYGDLVIAANVRIGSRGRISFPKRPEAERRVRNPARRFIQHSRIRSSVA